MSNNNGWGNLLRSYFKPLTKKEKQPEKKINTNYNKFEKIFYGTQEVDATEPEIPNTEYKKEMEKEVELAKQYLGEHENEIVTPINDYNAVSDDFTTDEIEEFKKLNGINDATAEISITDSVQEEHIDENIVIEQPTETKVKSVKVSKPKTTNESKKDIKKEVKKEAKPRTPKKNKK